MVRTDRERKLTRLVLRLIQLYESGDIKRTYHDLPLRRSLIHHVLKEGRALKVPLPVQVSLIASLFRRNTLNTALMKGDIKYMKEDHYDCR